MSSFATPTAFPLTHSLAHHVALRSFLFASNYLTPFPVADTALSRREEHAFVP